MINKILIVKFSIKVMSLFEKVLYCSYNDMHLENSNHFLQ